MSRQLKTLADAGWVASRRDGTSRYYTLTPFGDDTSQQVWRLTRAQMVGRPGVAQDQRRLAQVLTHRSATSQEFFSTSARQWDRLREDLFGADFSLRALIGLLPATWVVGDLGCGTGAVLSVLAPHVARAIGVDASEKMLTAARERLQDLSNVELRPGTLESLPIDDATLDAATLALVLHHLASPALALAEAARVLKPGGRLLIIDMAPHEREDYRQQMGHVWLGFADDHVRRLLTQAGFDSISIHALPTVAEAKGPALFAASASRSRA
jgi:ArsR family transcriptional regulator